MEGITFLTAMDTPSLIPSVESLLGKLDLVLRVLVMAGPLALLGLGLYYFLTPPKEANHSAGYRFRYGMSRVAVWQFMQRLAGMVYSGLGLVLTVIMAIICIGFGKLEAPVMVWTAVKCLLWEIVLVGAGTVGINLTVVALYEADGTRRKKKNEL